MKSVVILLVCVASAAQMVSAGGPGGRMDSCKEDEMYCDGGRCVKKQFVCDGIYQCADQSDEEDCSKETCAPTAFWCDDDCEHVGWRCTGVAECKDRSDEKDCPPRSPDTHYTCRNDSSAHRKETWCDGACDCPTEDEEALMSCEDESACSADKCQQGAFFCDGFCWHVSVLCNRVAHCKDDSDERDCDYFKH